MTLKYELIVRAHGQPGAAKLLSISRAELRRFLKLEKSGKKVPPPRVKAANFKDDEGSAPDRGDAPLAGVDRPRLSDAELISRLRLVEKNEGNVAAAAREYGISAQAFSRTIGDAGRRGLTAATKLIDIEDRLRTELRIAKQELASRTAQEISVEQVRTAIYGLAAMTPEPPRWVALPRKRKPNSPGVPVAIWSDWHYGETVFPNQVGNKNAFNRAIAKKRIEVLVNRTIDLAKSHMVNPDYPGIVVALGGDMITGELHEEHKDTNDGPIQQALLEVQEHLIAGIERVADEFGRVFVPCVVGNHARMSKKPRTKHRVFTSYEWNLYCQLERHFRRDSRVQFLIPESADAFFAVNGHRFCLTHGDSIGAKGGDGMIGPLGPITRGSMKMARNANQMDRGYDTLIVCHWHTYSPRSDFNGTIVNGALKGYDEYVAVELRAPFSRPSQSLFFVHPDHGVTAQWQVFCEEKKPTRAAANWVEVFESDRRAA